MHGITGNTLFTCATGALRGLCNVNEPTGLRFLKFAISVKSSRKRSMKIVQIEAVRFFLATFPPKIDDHRAASVRCPYGDHVMPVRYRLTIFKTVFVQNHRDCGVREPVQ